MASKKKPNIIFITFDDCRADHFGFMGYKKNTSPFLDSLAKESAYFTRAFATGSGSPQSFVGTMTSTYPLDYGGFSYIDKPRVLISEALQEAGYKTIIAHSAPYISGYFGYDRGWDVFDYVTHFKGGGVAAGNRKETLQAKILKGIFKTKQWFKANAPILTPLFNVFEKLVFFMRKVIREALHYTPPFFSGEEMNREAKKLVSSRPDVPLFLWVHYMDAHDLGLLWRDGQGLARKLKFHFSDSLLYLFGAHSRICKLFKNLFIEMYDATIREVDRHIGECIDYLKEKEILCDDDILVVFSDHGQEFFEKGVFGHEQRPFNANLNVPLIVWSPARIKARAVERPVSMIDVAPTVLELAGVPKPPVYKGKSVFDEKECAIVSQQVDSEGDLTDLKFVGATIMDQGYKFIDFRGKKMLFTAEDFKEEKDLYAPKKDIAEALEVKLKKYIPEEFRREYWQEKSRVDIPSG